MNDSHIDAFYRDAGLVLQKLYRAFPRKTAIYVEDISGPDKPDEYGLHSDRYLACLSTMVWLAEQGYLTYESTIRQEAIDQAVLTHKSFTLLSSHCPLNSAAAATLSAADDEHPRSNIVRLRQALKTNSAPLVADTMRQLLLAAHHFH